MDQFHMRFIAGKIQLNARQIARQWLAILPLPSTINGWQSTKPILVAIPLSLLSDLMLALTIFTVPIFPTFFLCPKTIGFRTITEIF
jgi:hypothetical protein